VIANKHIHADTTKSGVLFIVALVGLVVVVAEGFCEPIAQLATGSRLRAAQEAARAADDAVRAADETLENEIEQLRSSNARLAAIESRLARFEREHLSSSNPLSSTGDSSPS